MPLGKNSATRQAPWPDHAGRPFTDAGLLMSITKSPRAVNYPIVVLSSVLYLLAAPMGAKAFPSHCPEHFAGGKAPDLTDRHLARKANEVCFKAFAVLHSGVTRTPIFSAEHLTAISVLAARSTERNDDFHAESRLPEDHRAELADYRGSGFDRGHMTPNSDVADQDDEEETFSLANIVPQNSVSNRGLWTDIERATRHLAIQDGELWVVTGPIFGSGETNWLHGRVRVPTALFKAVYDPKVGSAGAYIADNGPGHGWRVVSMMELQQLTGIDVFPVLTVAGKAMEMRLPAPERRQER